MAGAGDRRPSASVDSLHYIEPRPGLQHFWSGRYLEVNEWTIQLGNRAFPVLSAERTQGTQITG
jgi:hypothetical protein